ncbi:MAG: hypothetical protein IPK83_01800 [Planctomycetes bacterium]|nr:hypothetical protein [Planctomycetota bacterium]
MTNLLLREGGLSTAYQQNAVVKSLPESYSHGEDVLAQPGATSARRS